MEPLTKGAEIWKADAEKRWADNVLLELRLARELEKQRQGQFKVFGLLLGDYAPCVEKGEDGKPTKPITVTKKHIKETNDRFGTFNFGKCGPGAYPDEELKKVEGRSSKRRWARMDSHTEHAFTRPLHAFTGGGAAQG